MGIVVGGLRYQIVVQQLQRIKDTYGSEQEIYVNYLNLRANAKFVNGTKAVDNEQVFSSRFVEFTTHYRKQIIETDRIVFDAKLYQINSIDVIGAYEGLLIQAELLQGVNVYDNQYVQTGTTYTQGGNSLDEYLLIEDFNDWLLTGNTSGYSGYSGIGISGYSGIGLSGYSGQDGTIGINGLSGYSGQVGSNGNDGASGYSGYSGIDGVIGVNGLSGYSGQDGTNGSDGLSGYSGQQGEQGFSGYSGLNGGASASGYSGINGTDGASGYSGYSGNAGAEGLSGYSGQDGTIGVNGLSGYSGQDGTNGTDGLSGYSGTNGADGASGYSGIDGTNGSDGASGYSGYSGIDGTNGTDGLSGYSGIDGLSGYSGQDGVIGSNGASGYSGIDGTNGNDGASGYSGYSGIDGTNGSDGTSGYSGIDGLSGYSGASPSGVTDPTFYFQSGTVYMPNANVSGVFTYVDGQQASGYILVSDANGVAHWTAGTISGYSGYSGQDGVIGSNGASGYSGIDGASGFSGYSGQDGVIGSNGASGYSGYSGADGSIGVSGYSGIDGNAGASGFSGYSGVDGFSGVDGLSGYSGTNGASGYSGYSGQDGLIAGLRLWFDSIASDMTIPTVVYTDLTWTNSGTNDYVETAGGDFVADGWVVGRKVKVTGASVAGNNGTWAIKTVTTTRITFTSVGNITSDSDAGVSVTFTTDRETLTRIPTVGTEQDESITLISTDGSVSIDNYCTVSGVPGAAVIPAGLWTMVGSFWVSSTASATTAKFTVRSITTAGVITEHGTSSTATITATSNAAATRLTMNWVNGSDIAINTTDRIIIRVQFNTATTTARTAHFIYQGSTRPAYVDTTFNVTAPAGASGYSGYSGAGASGYSGVNGTSGYSGFSDYIIDTDFYYDTTNDTLYNKNISLPTTTADRVGVIYKGAVSFIHDFHHPSGLSGTAPYGQNTFLGLYAGNLTMGSTATVADHASFNVGIGYAVLDALTLGSNNISVGYYSSSDLTTGSNTVSVGYQAGKSQVTGSNSVSIGSNASYRSVIGNNVAVGYTAGYSGRSGTGNAYLGTAAAYGNIDGSYNTNVGNNAGRYIVASATECSGYSNCTFIGNETKVSAAGVTNENVFGNAASGYGSNTVSLGNASITDTYFQGILHSVTTYSTTVGATNRDVYIDNTGKVGYVSSALRYKENITALDNINWIYDLNPVKYTYKNDDLHTTQYGLIAEQVELVNPDFVDYNEDGTIESVHYSRLIAPLIKTIQSLNERIKVLEAR